MCFILGTSAFTVMCCIYLLLPLAFDLKLLHMSNFFLFPLLFVQFMSCLGKFFSYAMP